MPAMPHLLLISRDPTALDAWRRGLAEAGVPIAGALSPMEAPLRLRAMRPSLLVLLEPAAVEALVRAYEAADDRQGPAWTPETAAVILQRLAAELASGAAAR